MGHSLTTHLPRIPGLRWAYEEFPTARLRQCLLRDADRQVAGRLLLQVEPEAITLRSIFVAPGHRFRADDPEPRHLGNLMLRALLDAYGHLPIWLRAEPDPCDPGLDAEGLARWYATWGWLPGAPPPGGIGSGWMRRDPLGLPVVGDPRHQPQVVEVARHWERWLARLRAEPLRIHHAREYEEELICRTYGFATPTEEAIRALADAGPVVEVGAGLGWWARLINEAGGSVVPTDRRPPPVAWVEVEPLADAAAVAAYPDRALLLIWPESWSRMASRTLRAYQGDRLWFVGELSRSVPGRASDMGDVAFHRQITRSWRQTMMIPLPQRMGWHDALYCFERCRSSTG